MQEMHQSSKKKFSLLKLIRAIVIVVLVGGIAGLGYLYYQTRQELKFLSSPTGQEELAKREVTQVVEALGKLAILPTEEPVVATITDNAALASQSAFYNNSVNGDKLVVYPEAKQAFIYSPSRNKIVNVGPLLIDDAPVGDNAQGTTEPVSAEPISIEVRNGSTTTGKATAASNDLKALASNVVIAQVTNAINTNYQGNVVVAVNPEMAQVATQVANEIGAQVATALPTGESSTQADILVIIGN
jgi:hypothetical protein